MQIEMNNREVIIQGEGIHFAVTICHGCEIKTDLCQAISGCVKLLPVPESFHDIEAALPAHRAGCTGQYAGYFFFRETIKELAHPDSIEPCRERNFGIEQIGAIPVDTHCSGQFFSLLTHHLQLLRKVHNSNFHRVVIAYALGCPSTGITSHIQ